MPASENLHRFGLSVATNRHEKPSKIQAWKSTPNLTQRSGAYRLMFCLAPPSAALHGLDAAVMTVATPV